MLEPSPTDSMTRCLPRPAMPTRQRRPCLPPPPSRRRLRRHPRQFEQLCESTPPEAPRHERFLLPRCARLANGRRPGERFRGKYLGRHEEFARMQLVRQGNVAMAETVRWSSAPARAGREGPQEGVLGSRGTPRRKLRGSLLRSRPSEWHTFRRAFSAASIFLRVPVLGARGNLAAQPESPAVRNRTRGSSLV